MGVIKGGLYSTEGMWKHNSTKRDKVLHVIHHKYTHFFITALLVIDLCVVITSISLEIEYLTSEVTDLEECVHECFFGDEHDEEHRSLTQQSFRQSNHETQEKNTNEALKRREEREREREEYRESRQNDDSDHDEEKSEKFLECEATAMFEDDDDNWGNGNLKEAEEALAYVSIAILCVFIIEHMILFGAMRMDYLRSPILIFDFFVIAVSLALEIIFQGQPEAGLLIVARAWRFIRILHGFHESTSDEVVKETVHALNSKREDILNIYAALDDRLLVGASKKEAMENVAEQYPETIFEILQILGHHFQKDKQEHLHIKDTIEHRMHPTPSRTHL
uniref:Voltage-gated hydrogen channel 1 n=1 Tax=Paramoeba aestuarina TaxID=180227 RepID=A0A7S4L0G9_9EUKA|mmetsp:Transcript_29362/g.45374  ORF Transcript_29362/g.45374 Transcript_29362/m.45374 type:complete len:335 (+) Transcript_29362:153-1157(+)|eukprot:CAMPEP_0201512076 /NCGR_PEP_ID=MMETSP0161_2-20130828/4419_1 /ASSEMBLY_ACC=CAM_ASM_000251 /TAXON_ID=180227 /ORGANISM="Neoparamoeba aestuarina, Strain SoJaBio B1-5/56/2" /LENGTH=334 /DNA_ID=CAMNT_0047907799 /DNA_START=138 /DNA_END=1142 /DNA_ORIENTATION=-